MVEKESASTDEDTQQQFFERYVDRMMREGLVIPKNIKPVRFR